ncbi:response regulator [Aestuariibacter halophilus]|uniref:Response regulator n=1 Tax=Fluctibacter halophilus TaxID=226011 RepID=A0ABS8G6K4_9ALTE|nr:response regulator [Aestuariibacter halophilus]MCC2616038.1 response regulator [Aestuariibacter halophilus]
MKPKVLIADSDDDLTDVLNLMFEDEFALTVVDSGQQALDTLKQQHFTFIILELELPDMSGTQICERIREMPADSRPHIVILTARTSDEDIKAAYALGVGDYIIKPFNVVAFHQRILRFLRDIETINALEQHDRKTQSLAHTAMKQAASYGSGLELIARLNQYNNIEQLMQEVGRSMLSQGFNCALELRNNQQAYHFDIDNHHCSKNEMKVFELLRDKGRIYSFGKRTIFNDPHTSILVKNMPVSGTMSYDAIIDLLAKLVPAISSRFIALSQYQTLLDTQRSLQTAISTVSSELLRLKEERQTTISDIAAAINLSFHELEFTEIQEQFFLELIEKKLNTDSTDEAFNQILTTLRDTAAGLTVDEPLNTVETDTTVSSDDIELF